MAPVELLFITHRLLALPAAMEAYSAGLALLREAFTRAGFQVGAEIPAELKGVSFYLGGFEVYDPGNDATIRVISMLGHSPMGESAGVLHSWTVTQHLAQMRMTHVDGRELAVMEIGAYRVSYLELAALEEASLTQHFELGLAAPGFQATPAQAEAFVQGLIEALQP